MSQADQAHMRRAIALARPHLGQTAENPSVGCVIVRNGAVVGEGATGLGGRPHAEEIAVQAAGPAAQGAVVYVTLEPCGARSSGAPSCAARLTQAGVAQVVIACADPSPYADGQGVGQLRAAGLEVRLGVLAEEAQDLYRGYAPARTRRPGH
ncbi:bifunctional diaminohydroxyphosphoribosylaminopyrimidine deaminase/5-amino-6-(5-phosphoribosylamino)uracil reductase RibD [Phenylobacterium sp.]|uniref:bifunctional diaminohydroxyphosphoribosylaminopyrimidine deaminase/5-amino-6-(5-phosphoribosylamino)uracil reductase RibD n=1 Tax=Phenylobacterium sp. TaxID=1871053 RepID=UPI00272F3639|nr:bifunctional diaminohydroxyphosphoribosylaminopyrimidine deaminase/5-amino-6-(5-phosphoribosylamino)uracil reductase RibD [Phenylobacterium sp.]MDP1873081.1 bifunctional diaminohydroxyphosphoribosylaminopyrimidine deaminase/5-amino-6-(5-phosphoribosylamino)uracil reductase RibD [Phenylobacterium sp.]MDP3490061.1 bifunctional diaminohydroxyphosphoribosylaminopyrimidine deaminase/5-amino-6-(5-phosphoribosylamino)uracil reductase RibD [Phenylobacterium sp.]